MQKICNCGKPAKLLKVKKEGPNKDKEFYACGQPKDQQCDFFEWKSPNEGMTILMDKLDDIDRKLDQVLRALP